MTTESNIRSMTAFARVDRVGDEGELTWEIRAVNHRFLEPHLRLPEELKVLEPAVRERLLKRLRRGKIDCMLRFNAMPGTSGQLQINEELIKQLLSGVRRIAEIGGSSAELSPAELLRWPGVVQEQQRDLEAVKQAALLLLDEAIDSLVANRRREGGRLARLLTDRCVSLSDCVSAVRERLPDVLAGVRKRILDRLAEVRAELDPNRIEQELALIAQRLDVDEEMDRLDSHLKEVGDVLRKGGAVGRRLDFLMQELNREANTLSSKSADADVTRIAVEMKVLIEQMREQVQNLE